MSLLRGFESLAAAEAASTSAILEPSKCTMVSRCVQTMSEVESYRGLMLQQVRAATAAAVLLLLGRTNASDDRLLPVGRTVKGDAEGIAVRRDRGALSRREDGTEAVRAQQRGV